jgi:GNAT superfamily N-acetyltransferase
MLTLCGSASPAEAPFTLPSWIASTPRRVSFSYSIINGLYGLIGCHLVQIVALAGMEIDEENKNVEMSDFATHAEYQSKGLASYLLALMDVRSVLLCYPRSPALIQLDGGAGGGQEARTADSLHDRAGGVGWHEQDVRQERLHFCRHIGQQHTHLWSYPINERVVERSLGISKVHRFGLLLEVIFLCTP